MRAGARLRTVLTMTTNRWVLRLVFCLGAAIGFAAVLALAAAVAHADCPPEGDGGDPDLNGLKNRTDVPRSAVDVTVTQISKFRTPGSKAARRRWPPAQRKLLAELEGAAVRIDGYVIAVKLEGIESTNCHDAAARDIHMWLADAPDADKAHAMVIEVTPRQHPAAWTLAALEAIAKTRRHVRITGWLLYDQEHPSEVRKSRATVWEIHPITNLEVRADGVWRAL